MTILELLAGELGLTAESLRGTVGVPSPDGSQDEFITVDPLGKVGAEFTGRLEAHAPGIAINADGNLNGGGVGGSPYRVGFGLATDGGTNGARGDSITVDTANGGDASQYSGYYLNSNQGASVFDDRGSMLGYTSLLRSGDHPAGDVYGEMFGFYAGITSDRAGSLVGGMEMQVDIVAGKPARASGMNVIVNENNPLADYATVLGAGSAWAPTGARGIDIISKGGHPLGTGLFIRGGAGYERAIVCQLADSDRFVVTSSGAIELRTVSVAGELLRLYPTVTGAQASFLQRGDGKQFWSDGTNPYDVSLERISAAALQVTGKLLVSASVGFNGAAPLTPQSITGSRGGNTALGVLLIKLAAFGLIVDNTTA